MRRAGRDGGEKRAVRAVDHSWGRSGPSGGHTGAPGSCSIPIRFRQSRAHAPTLSWWGSSVCPSGSSAAPQLPLVRPAPGFSTTRQWRVSGRLQVSVFVMGCPPQSPWCRLTSPVAAPPAAAMLTSAAQRGQVRGQPCGRHGSGNGSPAPSSGATPDLGCRGISGRARPVASSGRDPPLEGRADGPRVGAAARLLRMVRIQ
jgi:hypothetical protein